MAGVVAVAIALVLPFRAQADSASLEDAAARLTQVTDFLDNFADQSDLANAVPLSGLAPKDALALASVFDDDDADPGDSLKEKLASLTSIADTEDFEADLDALDFTAPGGIAVDIGGPESDGDDGRPVVRETGTAGNEQTDVAFHVEISKVVDVPLAFPTPLLDLAASGGNGTFPVTFTLTTSDLQFHFDRALAADPATAAQAAWITMAPDNTLFTGGVSPRVTLGVATESGPATLSALAANLGFTNVDVAGTLGFDFGYEFQLVDPDTAGGNPGDGKISAHELTTTALADLVTGGLTDDGATDAVTATITVASDLIDSASDPDADPDNDIDVTIGYVDASLTDAVAGAVSLTPVDPPIGDFRNFSADEALGAVLRLITMLDSLQATGKFDVSLPFVSGKTNAVNSEAAAQGTFSDVVRVASRLAGAVTEQSGPDPDPEIAQPSTDPANPNAVGAPTFANAQDLLGDLEAALGLPAGTIDLGYDAVAKRLTYDLQLSDDGSTDASLNFGDLDILSAIEIATNGTIALDAGYDLDLKFGLDLRPQPTEGGGGIGSCTDGVDNDGDGQMDVLDSECTTVETLEQRVAIEVGQTAGSKELTANLGVVASNVDAAARIGLLQAGVDNADLVVGSKLGEDGAGPLGPESCADGLDNDSADGTDMDDPACRLTVGLDLTDADDGWLTIRELLNALGAAPQPGVTVAATLDAGVDSTVPVSAELGGTPLGGGDIRVTGDFSGPLVDAAEFLDEVDVDGSDLATADLFSFSPCSNAVDDDGDGVINDGCPDTATDDWPDASDEPEDSTTALFAKIVAIVDQTAQQFEDLGIFPPGTLDAPLPLVGTSFNDLVSFADTLAATVDGATAGAESALLGAIPTACSNPTDDDFDGIVNDGCPVQGGGSDTQTLPESDCDDIDPDGTANIADDDGDAVVNDGCQPAMPSLQGVADMLGQTLQRLLDNVPDSTATVTPTLAYDAATKDLTFNLVVAFDYEKSTTFTLGELPGILGTIVSVEPLDATLKLGADLSLGFGLNLDTFDPFVLGSSKLDLTADVVGEDLAFSAGAGALTISVGQETPTPEDASAGQCDAGNTADDDGDGFANDGCPAQPNPETGDECTATGTAGEGRGADDDGDNIADDGCAGNTPAAVDTAESGDQCTGTGTAGVGQGADDDGDGIADDGCAQPNPDPAGPGGEETPEANCAITDNDDDDGDGFANDGCPARADKGRFFLGAALNLTVGPPGAADDEVQYSLDGSGTPLAFEGDFGGADQAGCDSIVIPAGPDTIGAPVAAGDNKFGCAVLPLYFGDDPLGDPSTQGHQVNLAVTDFDPLAISVHYDTSELLAMISSQLVDLVLMNSGLDSLLDALESLLESDLLSFALPILGSQTGDAAGIVDGLRESIKAAVNTAVAGGNPLQSASAGTAADVEALVDSIATAINSAINGTESLAGGAFSGEVRCGTGPDPAVCSGSEAAIDVSEVRFLFAISGDVDVAVVDNDGDGQPDLNFDIGVPGLSLSGQITPQGTVEWSFNFGIGVSRTHGFFFVTDAANELDITATARLTATGAPDPSEVVGTLGFLEVKIVDGDPVAACTDTTPDDVACRRESPGNPVHDGLDTPSLLTANFKVDLKDPGSDGRLSFSELASSPDFSDLISFEFGATADVNLHIETGFPGGAGLPKVVGDLHLDWAWTIASGATDSDALAPGSGSALTISLDNVALDVGSFVTRFVKPIFGDVKRFTDPLKPVIDTVTACIAVLSDLSDSCVSLLTLAETLNGGNIDFEFIKQVIAIIKFIQALPSTAPGNLTIPIGGGSFQLAGERLQGGTLDPTQARDAFTTPIDGLPSLLDGLNGQSFVQGAGSEATSENGIDAPPLKASGLAGIGITLPFLENPGKLLGLLFGQDVDLIIWEPAELDISFSYSQKFGPIWAVPPVFIEVGGSVGVTGRFGIGYTTKGFRNIAANGAGPAALLQGLFLVDKHPLAGGPDSNELELNGELFANAQVSVLIFSAGAQGSIFLTIGIDLQDPNGDGRLEYDEAADIIRSTGSVICIFNLNGQFGVRVSVFAEVDLFFWSQRWEQTLAEVILYEFKVECEPLPDPVLAHKAGTELILHIGTRRFMRDPEDADGSNATGTPDNSVGFDTTAENFVITKKDGGVVTISALGVTQDYPGPITKIIGDASDPAGTALDQQIDKITLTDGKSNIGSKPKLPFDIPSELAGGDGDDELTGSTVVDSLVGGPGADKLTGRDGVNTIHGDNADGTGTGNDIINSGIGDDHLFGGGGEDRITASTGADEIVGGDGSDNIDGGRSTLTMTDGVDTIWGDNADGTGTGNDTIDASDGADIVHAGAGADRVDGGKGNDTIDAAGDDNAGACTNGPIDDVLIGGPDADSISAGGGDDIVIGGNSVAGSPDTGDTLLDGQDDCDLVFGDNAVQGGGGVRDVSPVDPTIGGGETAIRGGNEADLIYGQLGNDTIRGDDDVAADDLADGNDTIYGDAPGTAPGDDVIFADGGEDTAFGGPGDDDVIGGSGPDHLYGDDLSSGTGQDFILGDDGSVTRSGARDSHDAVFGGGNGNDDLHGGGDRDHLYGQGGTDQVLGDGGDDDAYGDADESANDTLDTADTVRGGVGNDYLFGGNGADDMFGDAQNDRMVGGYPVADGDDAGMQVDGFGDHMYGGSGADTMAGDDATITSAGAATLLAEATIGEGDLMLGESGADTLYGENGNDRILGGTEDDHAEGGDDDDTIDGESGHDDLIGGTTEAADGLPSGGTGNQPDGSDTITGGTGGDVILGDNGKVTRPGGDNADGTPTRDVTLYDLNSSDLGFSGTDTLSGNESYDSLYGGAEKDTVHGNSEDDYVEGNNGPDDLFGDAGQDDIVGGTSGEVDEDGAANVGGDHPDVGRDVIRGGDGAGGVTSNDHDVACGDNCSIRRTVAGLAQLAGDDLDASRGVENVVRRQVQLYDIATLSNPLAGTNTSDGDDLKGEDDFDVLYGQGGDDDIDGGPVDDYLEGNAGHDTVHGQGGQDDIVGGTGRTVSDDGATAADGRLDTNDDLFGGDGADGILSDDFDVMMGDNATILRGDPPGTPGTDWDVNSFNASIKRAVFLYDVGVTGAPVDAGTNGPDVMAGEENDDVMYGQGDADDMTGADGDDYMEGNEGADTILGQNDNDDMIGGTGRINDDLPAGVDGRLDAGETMSGGDGFDVMAGDNAIVRRVLSDPGGAWLANTFNAGVQHERIQLLDVASLTNSAVPTDVSGGDLMEGNEDDDVMYGQGNGAGVSDDMKGNDGDDYLEGNAGDDLMEGNANQDDIIGGTGRINNDPATGTNGRFDGDDQMSGDTGTAEGGDGGDDYDVMTGDNAVVERPLTPLPAGDWKQNTFNDGIERTITMLDLELASAPAVDERVHGGDTMYGNGDDDIMRGQGGNDTMHGNDGDDDMEGNHAEDTMYGEDHQDDMMGGSRVAGRRDGRDFMFGGPAHDVMAGDNAAIGRPLTALPAGNWVVKNYKHLVDNPNPADDEFHDQDVTVAGFARVDRTVAMLDTDPTLVGPVSGSDLVNGNAGDDELYGQFDDTDATGIGDDANVPVLCDGVTPPTVDNPNSASVDATAVPIEGDLLCGEAGEDAIVGDQGVIVDVVETGSAATTVSHNGAPFIKEPVRQAGQLTRQVTLSQVADGGDDVAIGGLDHDAIHTGAGNDLANGADYLNPQGDIAFDIIFTGDDIDAAWGGPGHDHLYGGYEGDFLDVVPRTNAQFPPNGDPLPWFLFAADDPDTAGNPSTPAGEGYDGYQGFDLIYGGWDQDALQANEGGNGPVPGDRLVDWAGSFNGYYVCPPTYGEHISTRQESPSMLAFLTALAGHDGATTVGTPDRTTSSGYNELALVYKKDIKFNTNPVHPDTPAHFSCE